jgi:hypothetical protein
MRGQLVPLCCHSLCHLGDTMLLLPLCLQLLTMAAAA